MDPVQFPNYIQSVISMLEIGNITVNQSFARIVFLVADVDNLANVNDIDLSHILMNHHVNSLVRKLKEPLDVENMIKYNANIQQNLPKSQNRQIIDNVVAFVLKEINPDWIINLNESTTIPLFLCNTDHISSHVSTSLFQACISADERQNNYKRKRDNENDY